MAGDRHPFWFLATVLLISALSELSNCQNRSSVFTTRTASEVQPTPSESGPCLNGSRQCPGSGACYKVNFICDSYDDCGTGFDEMDCIVTDTCRDVETIASYFDAACIAERANGSVFRKGAVFAFNGEYSFISAIKSSSSWVEMVYLNASLIISLPEQSSFSNDQIPVSEIVYFRLNVSTISSMTGLAHETSILILYLTAGELTGTVGKTLRVPLALDPEIVSSVDVSISYVADSDPVSTPYRQPELLNLDALILGFTRYYTQCGIELEPNLPNPTNKNSCLRAAWAYLDVVRAASLNDEICERQEISEFISSMYDPCFAAPTILSISDDLSGHPGESVIISCTARGMPLPAIIWTPILPGSEITSGNDFNGSSTTALTIFLENGTDVSFTCSAGNLVGAVSRHVQVTSWDFRCGIIESHMNAQWDSTVSPCPFSAPVQWSQSPYGSSHLLYSPPEDGVLQSVRVGLSSEDTLLTFRVAVTTSPLLSSPIPLRRKRSIVPILYEDDFFNVTRESNRRQLVLIQFSRPVFVTRSSMLYINFLTLDNDEFGPIFFEVTEPLFYMQCPGAASVVPAYNKSCYTTYNVLTSLQNEAAMLGCEIQDPIRFTAYKSCLRIGKTPPSLIGEVRSPPVQLKADFTINCPIRGAVTLQWFAKGNRGEIPTFPTPSPILRFLSFDPTDQGYYYCRGVGDGEYQNQTVVSEPVLLIITGATTLAFSIGYKTEFIDITSESFLQFESSLKFNVQDMFFSLEGDPLSRSLLDNIDSPDFPTIVNTRNGSLIVDYIATFNNSAWGNATALVDSMTASLVTFFEEPRQGLQTIPGSITVGSASSCAHSVVTGSFGTLTFKDTPLDQTASSTERCRDYSQNTDLPRATRVCRGDFLSPTEWDDPVFADCFSEETTTEELRAISEAMVTLENVTAYSSDLNDATDNSQSIDAEGLDAIATALQKIIEIGSPSEEVTRNVIAVIDNVLGIDNDEYLVAIDVEAPTRILDAFEAQITLFQTQGSGANLTVIGESVAVIALQLPESAFEASLGFATVSSNPGDRSLNGQLNENMTMVYFDTDEIPKEIIEASIILPRSIISFLSEDIIENDMVPVSFFIFQQSKLFQSPDQQSDLGNGRRLAVGTRVIAATIEGVVIEGLPEGQEVETAFGGLNVTTANEMVDDRTCVFWEKTLGGGRWSSDGCRREDQPDIDRIRCLCDHLTSFAVLLDVSGDIGLFALDVLGIIGCVVSIVCLVITTVTYLCIRKLRKKQPQRILINLCVALLGLYLVFVIGIDRRYPTGGCVAVGFLIHFFLLASLGWMTVEAVNMYLLFVKVLDASVSKFMLKASLAAWGLPLLICIVIVAVDRSFYLGDNTYCFLTPGPALYYGVFLMVALLLAVNFIIFTLVMQRLSCRKFATAHKTSNVNYDEAWRRVQNAVAISVLLGLTWIFGFLAIGGARLIFNVLFLVFNSLQGFFVFLMFCVRQKEIRDQWLRWMRCQFGVERPGQRRGDIRKPKNGHPTTSETPSRQAHWSLATSTSHYSVSPEGVQMTSGGTLSTDVSSGASTPM